MLIATKNIVVNTIIASNIARIRVIIRLYNFSEYLERNLSKMMNIGNIIMMVQTRRPCITELHEKVYNAEYIKKQ
jgi:hypothetical protein